LTNISILIRCQKKSTVVTRKNGLTLSQILLICMYLSQTIPSMKWYSPPHPRVLSPITTRWLATAVLVTLTACSKKNEHTTWSVYKADAGSSSYSALEQINRDNVKDLKPAWTFVPNDAPAGSHYG
jgi:hypothetical protein